MSLMVTPDLVEQAQAGKVSDADFVSCIAASLPYAWSSVTKLATNLHRGAAKAAIGSDVPQTDEEWGQMFRMMASDSIRAAVERHYGVRIAFQNCCTVGVFQPDAEAERIEFISPEAQVMNQKPELRNC